MKRKFVSISSKRELWVDLSTIVCVADYEDRDFHSVIYTASGQQWWSTLEPRQVLKILEDES